MRKRDRDSLGTETSLVEIDWGDCNIIVAENQERRFTTIGVIHPSVIGRLPITPYCPPTARCPLRTPCVASLIVAIGNLKGWCAGDLYRSHYSFL